MENLTKSLLPTKNWCNPKQGLSQNLLVKYSPEEFLPFSQIISTPNGQNRYSEYTLPTITDKELTRILYVKADTKEKGRNIESKNKSKY